MKRLMLSTAMLGALAVSAAAESHSGPMFRTEADPTEIHASDFIGMRVYSSEAALEAEEYAGLQDGWEDIGEINDVVLSRDGAVEAVLVDIGGFLGIGERQVAVDMNALRFVSDSGTGEDPDDFFIVMNASRADFEGAPEYSWQNQASLQGEATMEETEADVTAEADAMADDPNEVVAGTTGADTMPRERIEREGYLAAEAEFLTTEKLTGAPVYDANDEWIGEVGELLVSADGKLTDAVIDVGGFLGIGEKPVALEIDKVDILRQDGGDEVRVYVPMSKDELEAMPEFEG